MGGDLLRPRAGTSERYVWRDPARLTEARRAELAEHDANIRRLAAAAMTEEARTFRYEKNRPGSKAARFARFAELRAELGVEEAGEAVGISPPAARKYERERRRSS